MDDSRSGPVFIPVDMELLSAYVDGELDYKTEAEIEHRLKEDPRAQSIVAQYRNLDRLLHQSLDPLPEDTNQRLADATQTRRHI